MIRLSILIPIYVLILLGCTNSRMVQPLNKNQWQVSAGVGGPVLKNESRIEPMAFSSISGAYGLTQSLTTFAGLDPSSALNGVYHMDLGLAHELLTPYNNQPGITYSASFNVFLDRAEANFKLYPQLDVNAYWLLPFRNDYVYIGISNWFELAKNKAHSQTQETRWIPGLHTGYTLQFDKYGFTLEVKYIAAFTNNENLLIDYFSPTDNGVLGAYFSIGRKF